MSSFISKVGRWSILLLILLVSGCGSSSPTESQPSGVQLPDEIVQLRLQDNGSIHAYVEVDGGQKTEMAITGPTAELQLTLTEGSHNIRVILEYLPSSGSGTPIILADTTKPVNVTASTSTPLAFASSDFDFTAHDDDKDGFSNLSEMQSGGSAPVISTVSPAVSSVDVLPASPVVISFDDPIDPDTLDAGIIVMGASSGLVNGTVSYIESTHTASFTPSQALNDGESYTVTIGSAIKNTAGVALSAAVSYRFTVNKIPPPPSVLSVTPDNNSVDVAVDTPIIITFNSSMKAITLSDGISLSDASNSAVTGSVSYDDSTHIATFTPEQSLNQGETYTVTVATSVQSSNGMALASAFTSSFTVVAAPLMVTSVTPADNSSDIVIDTIISVAFDSSINAGTLPGGVTLSGASSGAVTGSVSYDDNTHTATFTPSETLNHSEIYTLTVGTSVQNSTGVALASVFTSSFSIVAAPPTVVSVSPSNNSLNVANNTLIKATFDRLMDASTLTASSFSVTGTSSNTVSGSVSYDSASKTATFMPSSVLNYSEVYTATLSTAVQSSESIALASKQSWSFTITAAPVADIAFTLPQAYLQSSLPNTGAISAYIQVDGATRQAMTLIGSDASIQLTGLTTGSHQFTAILEYALTTDLQTLIILAESVKNISITEGSNSLSFSDSDFDFSLKDDDSDNISNFDEMLSGGTAPIVIYKSPLDGATGVLETTSITATFDDPMIGSSLTTSSFTVEDASAVSVVGAVSYDDATQTVTFTPSSALKFNETYTVTLSTAVQNSASIGLVSGQSWSFTIKGPPVLQVSKEQTLSSGSSSPVLAYNSAGDGMAVWQVLDADYALKYSVYDSASGTWSSEANLASAWDGGSMESQQLVSNGTGFALVWKHYDSGNVDLVGSFYDGVNWSTPQVIDTENTTANSPVLASNGDGYAVAWDQDQSDQNRIFASISTDASSWGSATVIDNSAINARNPKISSNGTDYAVIWMQDGRLGVNVYAGSWSSSTAALLDSASGYNIGGYNISSNGSGYCVVWDQDNVYSRTYYNSGGFTWSTQADIAGSNNSVIRDHSITSNGTGYAVTFLHDNGTTHDAYAVINAAGNDVWGAPALLESEAGVIDLDGAPHIASNGITYATIWSQHDGASTYDLMASVYEGNSWPTGVAIDAASDPVTSGYNLAGSGNHYVATWTQTVGNTLNLYANTHDGNNWGQVESLETGAENVTVPNIDSDPNGAISVTWGQSSTGPFVNTFNGSSWGGEVVLNSSPTGGSSYIPKLINSGNGRTLAVWTQTAGAFENLYVNIHENGAWGQPQLLSTNEKYTEFHTATDGNGFAVVWEGFDDGYGSIYASIFDGSNWSTATRVDSQVAGSARIAWGSDVSPIASNGNGYMLTYSQRDGLGYIDIYAREYDGVNWGTPKVLDLPSINYSAHDFPIIATNGTSYLVAWVQYDGSDPNHDATDAYSSEFDGTSWSTAKLIVDGGAANYIISYEVDLVSNGTDYLAVWTQEDASAYGRPMANIYTSAGWGTPVALDAGAIGHYTYRMPRAVSNGVGYAVAWKEDAQDVGLNRFVGANVYDGNNWVGPTNFDDGSSDYLWFSTGSENLISTDGNNYVVIWSREDSNGVRDLFANVYDGSWSPISALESGSGWITDINVVSNGNGFLSAWLQDSGTGVFNIMGNYYDPDTGWGGENVLDSDTSNSAFDLLLTGSSNGYLATWTQADPAGDPIVRFPWARVGF